ncbi:MAG: hypothetical protein LBP59_18640 [Planctomycetaceae bacterium]|nr:hypothetical protein [Planctomycetaceae bacterium]
MSGLLTAGQRPAVMKIPSLSGRRQNNENIKIIKKYREQLRNLFSKLRKGNF